MTRRCRQCRRFRARGTYLLKKFCSEECSRRYARRVSGRLCRFCEKRLPPHWPKNSYFCSMRCRGRERWRQHVEARA